MREDDNRGLDPDLVDHLARIPAQGQRWLKTAIVTIRDLDDSQYDKSAPPPRRAPKTLPEPKVKRRPTRKPVDLEEVIAGRASLDDQLEAYPELAEELEGLSDVIDLLREAGQARRRKGQDVLKELGLTAPDRNADDTDPEPDELDDS